MAESSCWNHSTAATSDRADRPSFRSIASAARPSQHASDGGKEAWGRWSWTSESPQCENNTRSLVTRTAHTLQLLHPTSAFFRPRVFRRLPARPTLWLELAFGVCGGPRLAIPRASLWRTAERNCRADESAHAHAGFMRSPLALSALSWLSDAEFFFSFAPPSPAPFFVTLHPLFRHQRVRMCVDVPNPALFRCCTVISPALPHAKAVTIDFVGTFSAPFSRASFFAFRAQTFSRDFLVHRAPEPRKRAHASPLKKVSVGVWPKAMPKAMRCSSSVDPSSFCSIISLALSLSHYPLSLVARLLASCRITQRQLHPPLSSSNRLFIAPSLGPL